MIELALLHLARFLARWSYVKKAVFEDTCFTVHFIDPETDSVAVVAHKSLDELVRENGARVVVKANCLAHFHLGVGHADEIGDLKA